MLNRLPGTKYPDRRIINAISQQTQNICITFVQRRSNVLPKIVQMLYKCFVFAGLHLHHHGHNHDASLNHINNLNVHNLSDNNLLIFATDN